MNNNVAGSDEINTNANPINSMTEKEESKLGFGAGLGIGLAIGALALLVVVLLLVLRINDLKKYDTEILDASTKQKLKTIEQLIDNVYYDYKDEPVSEDALKDGMCRGLVEAIGDPYSVYYSAEEIQQELLDKKGVYYGIGAYISIGEDMYPYFPKIMEDTPAEAAGLRIGDVIVKIDDESAYNLALEEVVSRVKGDLGTTVHLTIYREGEDDYLEFDIERAEVEKTSVVHEMLDNKIGYIGITGFESATVNQFYDAYDELANKGMKGLIIDLRGNTGGLVVSVIDICRRFLPEGIIVYEEDKNGVRKDYTCDGTNEIDIPLVILVNEYSASASEILTGAVRDYEIGTIVGKKTFGKGIVQSTRSLPDGSAIVLTESAYFSPKGINIQGKGIEPDVEVDFDADAYYNDGYDNQLEKAIEVMQEKLK